MTYRMIRLPKTMPVIIGMLLNLLSFALVIAAFVLESNEIPPPTGVRRSFAMWGYSILTAFMSIFLYIIDLFLSFRQLQSRKFLLIFKIILVFRRSWQFSYLFYKFPYCYTILHQISN